MGVGEMPKERIQSPSHPEMDVTVAWNREQYVQVASTCVDADRRLREWVEMDAHDAAEGEERELKSTKPGTSFKHFHGWHVDLDRYQINELIRVLRRARDQAFGRDE